MNAIYYITNLILNTIGGIVTVGCIILIVIVVACYLYSVIDGR